MMYDRRLFQLVRQVSWSVGSEAALAGKGGVGSLWAELWRQGGLFHK